MRAITFYEYGGPDVLKVEERPDPVPGPGQVLVKVRACSMNAADWHILRADPFLARFADGSQALLHRVGLLGPGELARALAPPPITDLQPQT